MVSNSDTDEVFDEEEIAEGFDEENVGEEDVDEELPIEVVVVEEDDVLDDADVELALDEVLAETIRRTSTPEDDDEVPGEVDTLADPMETILPKQDDEFRCNSCRLLKKTSQLAHKSKGLCRDCV